MAKLMAKAILVQALRVPGGLGVSRTHRMPLTPRLSMKNSQWHHRKLNPRPSGL